MDVRTRCRLRWGLAIVLFPLALLGGGPSAAGAPGPARHQDAIHEVGPGDNLHLIAGYYYGDSRQWERIWEANRDQLPDPNRITEGMFLRVPDVSIPTESYADFLNRTRPEPAPPKGSTAGPPAAPGNPAR